MNSRKQKNRHSPALAIFYGTHWRLWAAWYAVKDTVRQVVRQKGEKINE